MPDATPQFYTADPKRRAASLASRPEPVQRLMDRHEVYRPGDDLIRAVNVALLLGMPLLLTGAPGVGKTRLASHLAEEHRAPYAFYGVTSASSARDLLYGFDELGRMREAFRRGGDTANASSLAPRVHVPQEAPDDLRRYLSFRALGRAILRAGGPDAPLQRIAAGPGAERGLTTFADLFDFAEDRRAAAQGRALEIDWTEPTVVLIDEIDKAPRDLPNDLLTELDRMQFDVPELGVRVRLPDAAPRPIVLITSNAERALPEPFLRRCVYHHVEWPADRLDEIVGLHIEALQTDTKRRADARALVDLLRSDARIARPPGLAEMLQWLHLLERDGIVDLRGRDRARLPGTLGALLKTEPDMRVGRELLGRWTPPAP